MPYCSKCGVEYVDSAIKCSDCGIILKPSYNDRSTGKKCLNCGLDNIKDGEFCWSCGQDLEKIDLEKSYLSGSDKVEICGNCNVAIPAGEDFCIECGYILTGQRSCSNHSDKMTDFACMVCGKPFCKKCAKDISGKFICDDDDHYAFVGNWVIIASDTIIESLQPAKLALEDKGIYCVMNDGSVSYRLHHSLGYSLMVPIVQAKEAEKILLEDKLVFENACANCGHEFNGDPGRCPKCGEEFAL
ncbi:zinc ribbon domain-containing protein [candidate division KSB1 bacterium]